ncbi:sigma-54-dependent Fis family transcriptional regulator [Pseudomonas sp. S75]|uniref:sigma 54-interacting transcriptional regulator n=1 Tax=unclassified Pseudomonas TaxID=196821 RepID=UPI001905083C|nr:MULTISPECIES: sigma-54 dependent transcriptional regulator [unclassified Pseudomonas]MBJ9977895.1 sigma-54-dependent Fis family transcriptional regulator [Pseudomonas sp. S30]MBK0155899.1 sigma-54-dependent Fis family transcriptional regulator [Pseudomonas sp. S75]
MQTMLCAALSTTHEEDVLNLEAFAKSVAPLMVDVLLRGETGTGKDTLAEKIHRMSGRTGKFVAINCAAIPESLAESQLFGANTGAFTGVSQSRAGFIEAAHNGTLYLDEVDSMPLALQAKLLRVLESRTVQRLGSTHNIPVNMRVIASAQCPLAEMVERGEFRRDLYFRLNIVSLKLPPLRSRRERIVPLFQSLVQREAVTLDRPFISPPPSLLRQLTSYAWPGNIRELQSAAKRYVLGLPALPRAEPSERCTSTTTLNLKEQLQQFEKVLIEDCMRRHQRHIDTVIAELGIARRTLYYRMKCLEISMN